MKEYIAKVAEGENLTEEEAKKAMDIMLSGDAGADRGVSGAGAREGRDAG